MDRYRLFLAIELPLSIQKKLAQQTHDLRLKNVSLRPAQQLHITLQFLGLVEEDFVPTVIRHIEESLIGVMPFSLGVLKTGIFPATNRTKTLWYAVTGDVEKLTNLAKKLDQFSEKEIPFVPHVTVGTVKTRTQLSDRKAIAKTFLNTELKKPIWFPASEVVLFRSKLTRSHPIYAKVATFVLG